MSALDPLALSMPSLQLSICFGFIISGCYIGVILFQAGRKKLNYWALRFSDIPEFEEPVPDEKQLVSPDFIVNPEQEKRTSWRSLYESEWIKWSHVICAGAIAVTGLLYPDSISVVFILLVLMSASWTVLWVIKNLGRRRTNLFLNQLPEAIDIIVRGAQLGKSISQNLAIVGEEMPAPTGIVFRRLSHQLNIGMDLERALLSIHEISKIKEIRFLATTLSLQKEFGGEYAKILENLSRLLRDRRAHTLKTMALTSEARLSAKIVSAMTIAVMVFLAITSDTQLGFLLHDPSGRLLLLYCLVSNVIGFFCVSFFLKGVK